MTTSTAELRHTCPNCGEPTDMTAEIEDRDDSVGYHSIVEVCPKCVPQAFRGVFMNTSLEDLI